MQVWRVSQPWTKRLLLSAKQLYLVKKIKFAQLLAKLQRHQWDQFIISDEKGCKFIDETEIFDQKRFIHLVAIE